MSVGTFMLILNEKPWIEAHLRNITPHIDEAVFFDGGSTDGTLEFLREWSAKHPHVRVFEGKNPADMKDSYTTLFNQCLRTLNTEIAVFLHPDQWIDNPERLRTLNPEVAAYVTMHSYAGNPDGQLLRIEGRAARWKNIYRLRNPDLGAHYHGWYGAWNEDVYFSEITGDAHAFYGDRFEMYPYPVEDSGLVVHHFSDVRPYQRRLERMKTCLRHQGHSDAAIEQIAPSHARVSLVDGGGFTFKPAEYPEGMREYVKWGVHA